MWPLALQACILSYHENERMDGFSPTEAHER